MKLKDFLGEKYECDAKVKEFRNFYELKCHLLGLDTQQFIIVRKELYPKGINLVTAIQDNKKLFFKIYLNTKLRKYGVSSIMMLETGEIHVSFPQESYEVKNDNGEIIGGFYIEKDKLDKFVLKHRPIVESFFDNLIKLKKNKLCSNNCYYQNKRGKNGECDKMYILENESLL
ncbi:MAG TPA: hypothetical protein VIL99_04480 [Ignavibacteria bacterium]